METWKLVTFVTPGSNHARHGHLGSNVQHKASCLPLDGELTMHALHNHSIPSQISKSSNCLNQALSGVLCLLMEAPDGSVREDVANLSIESRCK